MNDDTNEINIVGELRVMKDMGIKPNFSELARKYGIDRHTIKKYYEANGTIKRKGRPKASKWDHMLDEIIYVLEKPGVSYKAAYMFFKNMRKEALPGDYNSFRNFCYRKRIKPKKKTLKPHVLYEVDPGYQIQVDYKESLSIHLKDGSLINFNVFSATLGYSRLHLFIYSPTKTTDDFIRCTIEIFRRIGGVTETALTDNMTAVVSNYGKNKKVHPRVNQLFKDLGCKLRLCKSKSPETIMWSL